MAQRTKTIVENNEYTDREPTMKNETASGLAQLGYSGKFEKRNSSLSGNNKNNRWDPGYRTISQFCSPAP
jgi:hypothetical protein